MRQNKAALRRDLIAKRQALGDDERAALSARIVEHLARLIVAETPRVVGLYLPVRGEVDLIGLRDAVPRSLGVNWALPVVSDTGREMTFREWRDGMTLMPNRFGILEPQGATPVAAGPQDILLVPCLAMDRCGVRLGYGGGFYDAFLAGHPVKAIGVVFGAFLMPEIPVENHDHRLPRLVTEAGVVVV